MTMTDTDSTMGEDQVPPESTNMDIIDKTDIVKGKKKLIRPGQ
jgi:hypothetical protein